MYSYCTNATMYYIILTGVSVCSIIFSHLVIQYTVLDLAGCPLSFETGGTMGYNCCFFLNFVPLHTESHYNFGGTGPILGVKNPLQRVNGHAVLSTAVKIDNSNKGSIPKHR